MVGGVLYVSTSASQVAAIDATTGRTLWVHDPNFAGGKQYVIVPIGRANLPAELVGPSLP
jgi:glucose dehydrogenase